MIFSTPAHVCSGSIAVAVILWSPIWSRNEQFPRHFPQQLPWQRYRSQSFHGCSGPQWQCACCWRELLHRMGPSLSPTHPCSRDPPAVKWCSITSKLCLVLVKHDHDEQTPAKATHYIQPHRLPQSWHVPSRQRPPVWHRIAPDQYSNVFGSSIKSLLINVQRLCWAMVLTFATWRSVADGATGP